MLRILSVTWAFEQRSVEHLRGLEFGELSLLSNGVRHCVKAVSHTIPHSREFRFCQEVAILWAVQHGELIPEEGNRGKRSLDDHLAGTELLVTIDTELILNSIVHATYIRDGFVYLISHLIG